MIGQLQCALPRACSAIQGQLMMGALLGEPLEKLGRVTRAKPCVLVCVYRKVILELLVQIYSSICLYISKFFRYRSGFFSYPILLFFFPFLSVSRWYLPVIKL